MKEEDKKYEVYIVRHLGCVLYVGEGLEGRCNHAYSGTSHVYGLNKAHFEGTLLDVERIPVSSKKEAQSLEYDLINKLRPIFNKSTGIVKGCDDMGIKNKVGRIVNGIERLLETGEISKLSHIQSLLFCMRSTYCSGTFLVSNRRITQEALRLKNTTGNTTVWKKLDNLYQSLETKQAYRKQGVGEIFKEVNYIKRRGSSNFLEIHLDIEAFLKTNNNSFLKGDQDPPEKEIITKKPPHEPVGKPEPTGKLTLTKEERRERIKQSVKEFVRNKNQI